jgi:hypothetical protein
MDTKFKPNWKRNETPFETYIRSNTYLDISIRTYKVEQKKMITFSAGGRGGGRGGGTEEVNRRRLKQQEMINLGHRHI